MTQSKRTRYAPRRVAVLGATGLVGRQMTRLLEERAFPVDELIPLASGRAGGREVEFRGEAVPVRVASRETLAEADLVLASAGGEVSRALLPGAAEDGAVCIDNTSAFRMDPQVPLVVPEVNGHRLSGIAIGGGGAIIANPNCSTIQLVAALKPIHDAARVRRVVVSTYQSISGAGREALDAFRAATSALLGQVADSNAPSERGLHESLRGTAAFDALPAIGSLDARGDSTEELKMRNETPKILEAAIDVDVCCVRVPVFTSHAESVLVETDEPLEVDRARELLARAPGVVVHDGDSFPTPRETAGEHPVHIGRIRPASTAPFGLQLWVVADNLLKGAALNAIQIAEALLQRAVVGDAAPLAPLQTS